MTFLPPYWFSVAFSYSCLLFSLVLGEWEERVVALSSLIEYAAVYLFNIFLRGQIIGRPGDDLPWQLLDDVVGEIILIFVLYKTKKHWVIFASSIQIFGISVDLAQILYPFKSLVFAESYAVGSYAYNTLVVYATAKTSKRLRQFRPKRPSRTTSTIGP